MNFSGDVWVDFNILAFFLRKTGGKSPPRIAL